MDRVVHPERGKKRGVERRAPSPVEGRLRGDPFTAGEATRAIARRIAREVRGATRGVIAGGE